jgi:hypothetical protein
MPMTASELLAEAAWGEEIKRRIDEIDSGTVELISEDEAMRRFEEHKAVTHARCRPRPEML